MTQVYVGSLIFVIGYVNYVQQEEGVSDVVIAVVVVAAVIVAVIVIVIAIMYGMRRRSHRRRHQVNKEDIVRLGGMVASRPSNLYYVHGFVSDNPSGDDLTGLPSQTGEKQSTLQKINKDFISYKITQMLMLTCVCVCAFCHILVRNENSGSRKTPTW